MHYYFLTGTSQGLGRALTYAILQRPDTAVLGISRQCSITHSRYQHQALDLGDVAAVTHSLPTLFPTHLDAQSFTLINNAGILGDINYVGELPTAHFQCVFEVNVVAPALLMNAFLGAYAAITHIPRTILNISCGAAQRPIDGWAAYCASKAALNSLSKTVQKEQDLRGSGVRVRALSPGVVDTAMQIHIRTAEVGQFSEKEKFVAFYDEGNLQSAEAVANRIADSLYQPELDGQVVIRL
jgi:benzil reductase ((S)-benzoin forming)